MTDEKIYEIKALPSKINGIGCFADEDIPEGIIAIRTHLREHQAWIRLNHRCQKPNLEYDRWKWAFRSLRPIKSGEELTFDYRNGFHSYYEIVMKTKCHCPDCRNGSAEID